MKIKTISNPVLRVLGIGALAGMRTSSAPAITSQILSHHKLKPIKNSPLRFLQSNTVANTLTLLTIGELIVDKLPTTPNRTEPASVIFRGLSGALAGASIFKATNNPVAAGAFLGAVSAAAATYASFYLRRNIVKNTSIIDPVVGGLEDALVIGAGVGLARL